MNIHIISRVRTIPVLLLLATITSTESGSQQSNTRQLKGKHVLVFTKNGKGYVHENIPASIAAIQKLGKELNFSVDTSTNSALRYIQAGGGFMGIHSASGTERSWKWFKLMLGATFLRHPPFQHFTVYVFDKKHPAAKDLPAKWETDDECYFFKEFNVGVNVLLVSDITHIKESDDGKNVKPDVFGNRYPATWCHEFDGGKSWYTALGHSKEDYSNPVYLAHIIDGLKWVTDKRKLDYKKSYATSSDVDEMKISR